MALCGYACCCFSKRVVFWLLILQGHGRKFFQSFGLSTRSRLTLETPPVTRLPSRRAAMQFLFLLLLLLPAGAGKYKCYCVLHGRTNEESRCPDVTTSSAVAPAFVQIENDCPNSIGTQSCHGTGNDQIFRLNFSEMMGDGRYPVLKHGPRSPLTLYYVRVQAGGGVANPPCAIMVNKVTPPTMASSPM
jgi:hypothetical protein